MIFGIRKMYYFDPYNVYLAIAKNIPQQLKTGFVVQGHISDSLKRTSPKESFVHEFIYTSGVCLFEHAECEEN